jgi:hypothetical protein
LQLGPAVEEPGQAPAAVVQDRLRILGGAGLVAVPQVAVSQPMEEEEPAEE